MIYDDSRCFDHLARVESGSLVNTVLLSIERVLILGAP